MKKDHENINLLITESAAAEILCVKSRMLRDLRARREIGFVRVGRHIRYQIKDLEEFVKSHVVCAR